MYGILKFGDQPLQKLAFQPFTTGSNRYGSDHMAGKLVSPTLLLLHRSQLSQALSLCAN